MINSYNPSNGEVEASIPDSSVEQVNLAVKSASDAFESWSCTTPAFRSEILNKIADILQSQLMIFAESESRDNGKPLSVSMAVDIPRAIHNFRFFANAILYEKQECTEDGNVFNFVHRTPVGVAALISPWNLPLYLLTWKIAPAIAYGCTCVCKPSEFTSITAWMLCKVFIKAGLPNGVVNMIFGTGPNAGSPLVDHPDVPLVSFTGGTATGEIIYQKCAKMNKKISLELGGKNASIVFEDCDLQDAINTTVRSGFSNQGQICLCTSRIFVHRSIMQEFISGLKEKVESIIVGDPFDKNTNMGPLVSASHLEKVLGYVDIAIKEGGSVVTGGNRINELGSGYYMRPAIIVGVHETESRVQKEEIFGPVITVCPFDTEEQAIQFSNSTKYGLSACIWTNDIKRSHRVSRKLKAGTVWINCWMIRDLNMPFGGVKASGIGREGNPYSREFFTDEKTICTKL